MVLQSTSYKALRTRARAYLAKDDYERAVNDFKEAIEATRLDGSADDSVDRSLRDELRKAEVQLKRSKTKDYYKILGLERTCADSEIKKAYRLASLKHHPDKVWTPFCANTVLTCSYRVVMRNNSNSSRKLTQSSLTRSVGSGTLQSPLSLLSTDSVQV